jgi:hypothetical protein
VPDNRISGLQAFKDSGKFGVRFLRRTGGLVYAFCQKDTVRPEELYFTGSTGVPLMKDLATGVQTHSVPGGDHQILLERWRLLYWGQSAGMGPLLYFCGKYRKLA